MSHHFHAVIWIDHHEARILEFDASDVNAATVRPHHAAKHLHVKSGSASSWRASEDPKFFDDVSARLSGIHEILLVGPANAKLAFLKHLQKRHATVAEKIVGVETVDHPSDGQLVHYARNYFKNADRMLPQLD
ncbi:MAG: translational machinery protein [Alphaproteobacteria bacterium]|jgi:stalled ribosome rescue protein Dom34|nr:translational machinery protein [Rhodobiaceae bacterium]MBO6544255.1 translational machinery protein [Alphaproteobacteria bacterium]MBO6627631.1 translational machinery protein [Alphaproteobacteria bacterium]MDF1627750.1 translational machinery protein [Parvibaculaceae bacterium]|tara:strand:- start:187 stop:585 length:399 start_codon:yes stop_codon:yes gene_type:complete